MVITLQLMLLLSGSLTFMGRSPVWPLSMWIWSRRKRSGGWGRGWYINRHWMRRTRERVNAAKATMMYTGTVWLRNLNRGTSVGTETTTGTGADPLVACKRTRAALADADV